MPAWLPPSASFPKKRAKPDPAARTRRAVGGWLRQLADIGWGMALMIDELLRLRQETGRAEREPMDLTLGWVLLSRGMRWIKALRARMAAEARAARPPSERQLLARGGLGAQMEALMRAMLDTERKLRKAGRQPKRDRQPREPGPWDREWGPDVDIDGKSAAEVVAQACADLHAAGQILFDAKARRRIEAIAAAARALLGPSEAAPLPPPRVIGRPAAAPVVASGGVASAPAPAPGPGTG